MKNFIFSFIFISWRLITLQYCSGFCHTLTWISHGFTCVKILIATTQCLSFSFQKIEVKKSKVKANKTKFKKQKHTKWKAPDSKQKAQWNLTDKASIWVFPLWFLNPTKWPQLDQVTFYFTSGITVIACDTSNLLCVDNHYAVSYIFFTLSEHTASTTRGCVFILSNVSA